MALSRRRLIPVVFERPSSLNYDEAVTLSQAEWRAARDACIQAHSAHLLGRFLDGQRVTYLKLKSLRHEAREQVEKMTRVVDALDRAIIAMERYNSAEEN